MRNTYLFFLIIIFACNSESNKTSTEMENPREIAKIDFQDKPYFEGSYSTKLDIGRTILLDSSNHFYSARWSDIAPRNSTEGTYSISLDTLILKDTVLHVDHDFYGEKEEYLNGRNAGSWLYPEMRIDTLYFWTIDNEYALSNISQSSPEAEAYKLYRLMTKNKKAPNKK